LSNLQLRKSFAKLLRRRRKVRPGWLLAIYGDEWQSGWAFCHSDTAVDVETGNGPALDARTIPPEKMTSQVDSLLNEIQRRLDNEQPQFIGLCMPDSSRRVFQRRLAQVWPEAETISISDAERLIDPGEFPVGVVLYADLRAFAVGRRLDGYTWISGDWPVPLGSGGSLYELALLTIGSVLEIRDGRQKPSMLRGSLLEVLGFQDFDGLLMWLYTGAKQEPDRLVKIVDLLSGAAASGDPLAVRLVNVVGNSLGACVTACLEQLGLTQDETVVRVGGRVLQLHRIVPAIMNRVQYANENVVFQSVEFTQTGRQTLSALQIKINEE
jgi:N-acetylglucosamine kinase-like BadF-type ATPase